MDYSYSKYLAEQRKRLKARLERVKETYSNACSQSTNDTKRQITLIDLALKRIEEGTYGLCMPCGCPIEEEALEVEPETLMCNACKRERQH